MTSRDRVSAASFDEATSRRLERMYGAREVVYRRQLVRQALAPVPGERILDIGCGPGFYEAEVSPELGRTGLVVGVDSSEDMLALARDRCAAFTNVEFRNGDASALPVENGAFDAVLCVQVLEYLGDAAGGIAEMTRALRPGGRAVIWDTDWATVSWHSSDAVRMQRVLAAFDEHLAHPSLPRTLGPLLRATGFMDVTFTPYTFATDKLIPDTFGGQLPGLVRGFVPGHQGVTAGEVDEWSDDLRVLAERGEFFFSATQFCFTATKPH
jgi:ubiquinone/menaquinone biosynthesis C-methylase UbiE